MDPSAFSVPADHPAMSGHFPGNPVVPGVLILDYVLRAYEASQSRPMPPRTFTSVKFLKSLRPGEVADIAFDVKLDKVSFSVFRNGTLLVKGVFESCGGSGR
jgi:3-hydroxymyristoyl/3-hydroxydecanoyl-(acyl carrier protein) dehydratase